MLRRKIMKSYQDWLDAPQKTALLVTGARQVGKTYSMKQFAQEHFKHVAVVDFVEHPDLVGIFQGAHGAKEILQRLSLAIEEPLVPGETLVFFDEVQECTEIVSAIKYLVEEGSFRYALSGSLLGVELEDIRSVPVGYTTDLRMYPLDFEEFCWSQGVEEGVFDELRACWNDLRPIDPFVHKRLLNLYSKYLVIGGMPAAVASFNGTDLGQVRTVQENIRNQYRHDISKYAPTDRKLEIKEIYDLVPSELNNPNKRFVITKLDANARFRSYQSDFLWLVAAGVAIPAYNVDAPESPLLLSKKHNLFKLFYSDVGLLTSSFSRSVSLDLLSDRQDVNYGCVFENAVAQELVARGFDLYYFNSKKYGELDFVVQDKNDRVVPIEVKSGKSYKRHAALNNVLEVENYHLERGYVFGPCNIEVTGKLVYAPVYLAGMLESD